MKNLKITLIASLILISFTASAQFKFGTGGGLNLANFSGSDVSGNSSLMGFNAGLMMEVKLPVLIGVEGDVLFSTKGATYSFLSVSEDMKLSYIDIPVVVKFYTLKVISFQLGAQYSMLTSASFAGSDIKDDLKPGDLSAVLGLGVDVMKLHISARYNYGLASIDDGGSDVKNNMLTLSVGIWLKK